MYFVSTNSKMFENKNYKLSRRWLWMTKEMWNFISSSMNPNKCDDKWHGTPPRTSTVDTNNVRDTISYFLFRRRRSFVFNSFGHHLCRHPLTAIQCERVHLPWSAAGLSLSKLMRKTKKFEEKRWERKNTRRRWLNFKLCHAKRNLNLVWAECVCVQRAKLQTRDLRCAMWCHSPSVLLPMSRANVLTSNIIKMIRRPVHNAYVHFSSPNASVRSVPFRSFCV